MTSTAERITRSLGGRWHVHYGLALCPAHQNTRTPALSLSNGDNGQLLAYCHAGCSFRSVVLALKGLGITTNNCYDAPYFAASPPNQEVSAEITVKKREAQAKSCWEEAMPIAGTPAEQYLRNRGITCELPPTLRYHPACWHGPSAHHHPAMISLIEGDGTGIHRTYLHRNGQAKATVSPAKMMLGAAAGGAVRLSQAQGPLIVAEGIETALSLASGLFPEAGAIWAALSTSGMSGLTLPIRPKEIVIATDGDDAGQRAGNDLAERAHSEGWKVSLLPAPNGRDWNDILLARELS